MKISLLALLFILSTPSFGATKKRVERKDYGKEWPLTVSYGEINCLAMVATFTAPDGKQYALNGVANMRGYPGIEPIWMKNVELIEYFKKAGSPYPPDSEPRISITPLLNDALDLCGK